VPGELLALLEIALYVEPRSAVLEKLLLCVLDALLKLLESYYGILRWFK
jgi:hypothetical protein